MSSDDRRAQLAARRLLRLADQATPRTRQQIERALNELRLSVPLDHLERVIQSGDYFSMTTLLSQMPKRMAAVVKTLRGLFLKAAAEETLKLRAYGVGLQFNVFDPFMIESARLESARMVRSITDESRRAIQHVMARSFREGIRPRNAAKMIRSVIGLTERQSAQVTQYHLKLVASGKPAFVAQQSSAQLADKLLRQRAVMIARTETIAAATSGQLTAWRAAQQRGLLPTEARKVWLTTPDDRMCKACRRMHGQSVLLYSEFVSPYGPVYGPPLHPQCRCALALGEVDLKRRSAA